MRSCNGSKIRLDCSIGLLGFAEFLMLHLHTVHSAHSQHSSRSPEGTDDQLMEQRPTYRADFALDITLGIARNLEALMSEVFEFDGSIEIAGVAQSDRVAMLFSADGQQAVIWNARLGGAAKKTLHLLPCSVWMMRGPGPYATKGEFHYAVSGTRVGSYTEGPLGHPGDGEFDSRPISNFELRCKFSPDSLMVEIGGVTEEGISGFQQKRSNPLSPWLFRVRFVVPRAQMKKFFGFKDHNFPYFEESLDECR